jgi:cytoskeletal protein RodZ
MAMQRVGEILKRARESKSLTFAQVQNAIKIHPRFLTALEEGNYHVFSSPVHLKGFLKNYAEFLQLDVPVILAFFRREYDELQNKKKKTFVTPLLHPFTLTPNFLLVAFTLVAALGFSLYLLLAYRSFTAAPELTVENPPTDLKTTLTNLQISGQTDPEATLTLNGQRLLLDEGGRFHETLRLSPGQYQLNFIAASKSGREKKVTRTVFVEAAQGTPSAETRGD